MNVIDDLLSLMTKAEEKSFVVYLEQRNKRHDTRNVSLFTALRAGNSEKLQKEIGSNAYGVLKKRLSDRLLDFMSGKTLEKEATEEIKIIKQLLICRKLFAHSKYKTAFKSLRQTEELAISIGHYSLLNEIYQTYIQYSFADIQIDQDQLLSKFNENNTNLLAEGKLNMAYAIIRKAYHKVEYKAELIDFRSVLESAYKKLDISDNHGFSFKSLYQLAQIADVAGAYSKDYHSIDLFFVEKLKLIEDGKTDNQKFLRYHIDVLYHIANIYFRQRKFDLSIQYLERMYVQMNRFEGRYYGDSEVKYKTLMALNLNYSGENNLALSIVKDLIETKAYVFDDLLYPQLVLLMIHFQQGEMQKAQEVMSRFNHSDLWYERKVGLDWILNKNFAEVILHIELGNSDYAESRLYSLKRKLNVLLKDNKNSRVLFFLKLITKIHLNPAIIDSAKFKAEIDKRMEYKPAKQDDIFIISFYAWLKAKMENIPLYELTVDLARY